MSYIIGVDENGLGPRLGPLVVTAVGFRAGGPSEGAPQASPLLKKARGALATRLGDSKALASYDDSSLGEAWARAIARRALGDTELRGPEGLLRLLFLDPEESLRSRCPEGHGGQCWSGEGESFTADAALVGTLGKDLEKLAAKGLVVHSLRSHVVCTERLNDAASAGQSRFLVDLHAMERLVLSMREGAGEDVYAVCGKVGGYNRYGDAFGPLGGRLHVALEEGRARSAYRFPGVGTIAFVRDADAGAMIVGLASLVGKWVRDHFMRRVVRWHQKDSPEAPDASGYHDPVTARFVAATALARRARGFSDDCFERAGGKDPAALSPPRPPSPLP